LVNDFQTEIDRLLQLSVAPSTARQYGVALRLFNEFRREHMLETIWPVPLEAIMPEMCLARTCILLRMHNNTNGRTNCIIYFDFEVLLLTIATKAWLSIRNKIFLLINLGVQKLK
jgi:hypothetical protein